MNNFIIEELLEILRAITVQSAESFSFAGKDFGPLDPSRSLWQVAPAKNPLVAQLAQQLYSHAYCRKFNGRLADDAYDPNTVMADDILAELSSANSGRERWDVGWQVQRLMPSAQIIAYKGGLARLLWPGEFVSHEGPGVPVREGSRISVFAPRESTTMQPGFYFIFSETVSDQQDDYSLLRFYWHISDATAPKLVQLISHEFNRFQIPFRLKSLAARAFYRRSDAAVLYVNKRFYRLSTELLSDIHDQIREGLGPDTPLFTKRLAPGLGLAEEPGNGESFGQNRCRILAESIWSSHEKNLHSEPERLEEARKHFASKGLALDAPYLNPGSTDKYEFPPDSALERK